jgi:hypothetical protein
LVSWRQNIEQALSSILSRKASHLSEAFIPWMFQHKTFQIHLSIKQIGGEKKDYKHNHAVRQKPLRQNHWPLKQKPLRQSHWPRKDKRDKGGEIKGLLLHVLIKLCLDHCHH